jgi:hypothetical protein
MSRFTDEHAKMRLAADPPGRLSVWLIGACDFPDFREVSDLLRRECDLSTSHDVESALASFEKRVQPPELVIIALNWPRSTNQSQIEQLRRLAPLAGFVALAGTWCEGEPRTGRPPQGVRRLYWYEFAGWWQRQNELRAAGLCPEWAMPPGVALSGEPVQDNGVSSRGLIVLGVPWWETADALSDILRAAGYSVVWQRPAISHMLARGAAAGIWEGGQLNAREAKDLQFFCSRLGKDGAPVIALLDFPRFDSRELALASGAAAVIAKPWVNDHLMSTLQRVINNRRTIKSVPSVARAA